jgi:hypothetical protein
MTTPTAGYELDHAAHPLFDVRQQIGASRTESLAQTLASAATDTVRLRVTDGRVFADWAETGPVTAPLDAASVRSWYWGGGLSDAWGLALDGEVFEQAAKVLRAQALARADQIATQAAEGEQRDRDLNAQDLARTERRAALLRELTEVDGAASHAPAAEAPPVRKGRFLR